MMLSLSLRINIPTKQFLELLYMHLLNLLRIDSGKVTDVGAPRMLEDLQLFELVTAKMIAAIGGNFGTS